MCALVAPIAPRDGVAKAGVGPDKGDRHIPDLETLSRELKRPLSTLMALAASNDPFNAARTPTLLADALWFKEVFELCSPGGVLHLRRLHYRMVSRETPLIMRDGKPYENTSECWGKLLIASKQARYANLVQIDDFEDKRAPAPTILLPEPAQKPSVTIVNGDSLDLRLPEGRPDLPSLGLHAPLPTPYHIELWCEKSTIDDILKPLARQYGLNVVTGVGELSITRCKELVDRAVGNGGRPVRIIYVSDFDPAGQSMPVAVARKIEFLEYLDSIKADIQIEPVLLTYDQCRAYKLPRTPLKESEARADRFEARFGEGATELDALEALHPGELRRILTREIERFIDPTFERRWREASRRVRGELDNIHVQVLEEYAGEINDIDNRVERLRRLVEDEALSIKAAWLSLSDRVEKDLESRAGAVAYCLSMPEPEPTEGWADPLYCSSRSYVEQIDRYKRHQDKPIGRAPRSKKREVGAHG